LFNPRFWSFLMRESQRSLWPTLIRKSNKF